MASNPTDFLTIAKELANRKTDIDVRTSISRSYYGAYHLCREYLGMSDNSEWVGGQGGVHQKLIDEFKFSKKPSDRGIAYILADLKGRRIIADYKINTSLTIDDAQATLEITNSLFERIKKA